MTLVYMQSLNSGTGAAVVLAVSICFRDANRVPSLNLAVHTFDHFSRRIHSSSILTCLPPKSASTSISSRMPAQAPTCHQANGEIQTTKHMAKTASHTGSLSPNSPRKGRSHSSSSQTLIPCSISTLPPSHPFCEQEPIAQLSTQWC